MNKKIKMLVVSSLITISTFTGIGITSASEINRSNSNIVEANRLLQQALSEKTFYKYNLAYTEITKVQDKLAQESLMQKLAAITSIVWTDDVKKFNKTLDDLVSTKGSGKIYDQMEAAVGKSSLQEIDKGYLLGELTSWGRKLVYTADYTRAVDSLNTAWRSKSNNDIVNAENNINLVVNNYSKDYLKEELLKLKSSISGNDSTIGSLVKTSSGKSLIYDKEWTERLSANKVKNYLSCSNVDPKLSSMIQSALNISQGKDVTDDIKTKWVRNKIDDSSTGTSSKFTDKREKYNDMNDPKLWSMSDYVDTNSPDAYSYLFSYIIVYRYPDNPSLYEVHQVKIGI